MKYNWKLTVWKGVKVFILFILPWLVDQFIVAMPEVANITIGTLLVMLCNFLKMKAGVKFL